MPVLPELYLRAFSRLLTQIGSVPETVKWQLCVVCVFYQQSNVGVGDRQRPVPRIDMRPRSPTCPCGGEPRFIHGVRVIKWNEQEKATVAAALSFWKVKRDRSRHRDRAAAG